MNNTMYCRCVVFTDAPLIKALRYRDVFQFVPFFYFPNAPFSVYARHFPCFLEYKVDNHEERLPVEDMLRGNGLDEEVLKLSRRIPSQIRARKEVLHLLTSLTNFRFFDYASGNNCWGIQTSMKDVGELTAEELDTLNNQTSHWTIRNYVYPNCADDLKINTFTACKEYYYPIDNPRDYFTVNCNLDNNTEIKIPPYFDCIIDRYFALNENERTVVRQCVGLLYEGVNLFDTNRSISLLSIVSSIEGMAKLDLKKYGNGLKLGPTDRFLRDLKTYVAGRSEDKYRLYYKKRCEISHEGALFLSDLDIYGDIQKQDEDWRFRLEVLQAARLALYNWLRRKNEQ